MNAVVPLHVVPNGDQVQHLLEEDCICGPRIEMHPRWDRPLVVHHSLDGREAAELSTLEVEEGCGGQGCPECSGGGDDA